MARDYEKRQSRTSTTTPDHATRRQPDPVSTTNAPAAVAVGPDVARHPSPDPALALRVIVERLRPQIDGGRFPAKRTVGDTVDVLADIFADGHDVIIALLRDRPGLSSEGDERPWRESPMTLVAPGTDEWTASFTADAVGWHEFAVVAWVDPFATWAKGLKAKADAGQDVNVELIEGATLVREAAARAAQVGVTAGDAAWLEEQADALSAATPMAARVELGLDVRLAALMFTYADRRHATLHPPVRLWVDREKARFGAWYEMFPRSAGPDPTRSATFREAAAHLPYVADLGFDVLYLPPIHPIGRSFRKGPNNTLQAGPGDPGSPWAIGSEEGGHTAVEPGLGTLDDFEAFNREANRLGIELALDIAWQCSPDHPWVKEHPEWFRHRPDGTIKYAENPPKKYQDIYPLDFACEGWRDLWQALLDVTRFWLRRGVRIFRVDNPHTKSFGFWEWLIAQIHAEDPGVIFLSEAFTRPRLMRYLAKAGFTQSYTYFTWRNTKAELEEYLTELTTTEAYEYLRPNFFANTPDILHAYLQEGGRPAFEARLVLAATLSSTYGIYSGFELCENRPAGPKSEEYLDSEKYQIRQWDWNRPGNIKELVRAINTIRRGHPALQWNGSLRFCTTDNPELIAYVKTAPDGSDPLLVIVNLDPRYMQHGHVDVPLELVGIPDDASYVAHDLITDTPFAWTGARNYVRLDPGIRQAHVFELQMVNVSAGL
jgi:starch synthase (maltosyl-transferring)